MTITVLTIRRHLLPAAIIIIAFTNILSFIHHTSDLPARNADQLVVQEERYRTIRELLVEVGYKGPVDFFTNRDLKSEPPSDQDGVEYAQSQYVMIPWLVLRNGKAATGPPFTAQSPFVIGDFWDTAPSEVPPGLIQFHDTGRGLILYRRKQP